MIRIAVLGAKGKMGQALASLATESPRRWKIVAEFSKAEAIIDFSSPQELRSILRMSPRLPLLSGTTGLSAVDFRDLRRRAKKGPVFWSPNMSLGIAVLRHSLQQWSLLEGFDFQIEETHHRKKKDKPSGTAKILQNELKSRVDHVLPVISIRTGNVPGTHRVMAFSENERLTYEHKVTDRRVFARGALQIAEWLVHKRSGFFTMDDYIADRGKK